MCKPALSHPCEYYVYSEVAVLDTQGFTFVSHLYFRRLCGDSAPDAVSAGVYGGGAVRAHPHSRTALLGVLWTGNVHVHT